MKEFSAVHLLHDVGIALMSADEERDLAELIGCASVEKTPAEARTTRARMLQYFRFTGAKVPFTKQKAPLFSFFSARFVVKLPNATWINPAMEFV